ncbi:hypothetical protein Tco_0851002, partial [Tanacetum coccineum]
MPSHCSAWLLRIVFGGNAATKKDLEESSKGRLQGTKKTGIGRTQEGLCQWRQLLLMLCSNSEVSTDSNCSSSCLENVKILKEQNEQLLKDLRTSKLNAIAYKIGNFMPPKPDLSFSGLEEFTSEPIVIKPIVKKSEAKASKAKPKAVTKNNGKTTRKTAKQVEQLRQNTHTPRGNQINWKNMMSQRLGSNFEMFNKACFVCGSFDHLQRVNTVKDKNVNIARPKAVVNAAKPKAIVNAAWPKAVVNVVKGNNVNAIKASTCWVWKLKNKVLDHVSKHNSASITLKKFDYVDAQGIFKHMTGNMSYLTDYEEINGGYVAFGGNPKGGKITDRVI